MFTKADTDFNTSTTELATVIARTDVPLPYFQTHRKPCRLDDRALQAGSRTANIGKLIF